MKRILLVLLICLSFASARAALPDTSKCSAVDVASVFPPILQAFSYAQSVSADGNLTATLITLEQVKARIVGIEAKCAGLSFTGTGQLVIGPFDIPAGVYRATGVFSELTSVVVERLSGDCGLSYSDSDPIFIVLDSDAGKKNETVFRSQECQVLLQVNTSGDWSVGFELVMAGN